ncbi:hypothetical protein D9757_007874 [Collybiopsis confluens]|uniref:F-box domain-containing protein n=1 Tax=Collybiopsis confluens TaxID=2823264 RepID=A0A8H5HDF6_9AGAR|nr:hypothetical protein D9757_007874 [Collybiopsis confluens]
MSPPKSLAAYQDTYTKFRAKCRSNHIPISPLEEAELGDCIESTRHDLQNRSGSSAQDLLLSKTLDYQTSLLAPIRRLPPEIYSHIFSIFASISTSSGFNVHLDVRRSLKYHKPRKMLFGAVFTLTWVCSSWRAQAILQSDLWASLNLVIRENKDMLDNEGKELWSFLRECILRAGDFVPLDLRLDLPPTFPLYPDTLGAFECLMIHAHRWRRLIVDTAQLQIYFEFLKRLAASTKLSYPLMLPSLEEIRINFQQGTTPDERIMATATLFSESFPSCPRLQTIGMSHLMLNGQFDRFFQNLTVLEIGRFGGRSFAHLLGRCPLLRSLTIHDFRRTEDLSSSPSDPCCFCHAHLSALTLEIGEYFPKGVWADDALCLPSLSELSVSFGEIYFDDFESTPSFSHMQKVALYELRGMLVRSQCRLRLVKVYKETVHGYCAAQNAIDEFLASIPLRSDAVCLELE